MNSNPNDEREQNRFDTEQRRRLEDFDARLAAGDFDLGLELSALTGEQGLEQQRQAFAFAAWTARVSCDPAEDFDDFVEYLWQSVEALFQLGERVGGGDGSDFEGLPASMRYVEDPSVVVWGDE